MKFSSQPCNRFETQPEWVHATAKNWLAESSSVPTQYIVKRSAKCGGAAPSADEHNSLRAEPQGHYSHYGSSAFRICTRPFPTWGSYRIASTHSLSICNAVSSMRLVDNCGICPGPRTPTRCNNTDRSIEPDAISFASDLSK